jgi:hypothetical protein
MGKTAVESAVNIFGEAPTIAPKKAKASSSKDRAIVPFEGFDKLAALGIVSKAIESVQKQVVAAIKEVATDYLVSQMLECKTKPDSFTAKGELATGLVSLRKRGSHLRVAEETAEALIAKGVPMDILESVPERLVINPEILEDQGCLKALAEAIKGNPLLESKVVIMKQEAEKHYAVSDDTIPTLARTAESADDIRDIIGKLSSVSIGRFVIEGDKDGSAQKKMALEILFGEGIL